MDINLMKSMKNRTVSDLKLGQYVRLKIGGKFTKSSEPQWSDNVFKVSHINFNDITLDDGPVVRRNNLLVVPDSYVHPTIKIEEEEEEQIAKTKKPKANAIVEARKDAYIDRQVKKSGIDRNDDTSELVSAVKGRDRKKKMIHDA